MELRKQSECHPRIVHMLVVEAYFPQQVLMYSQCGPSMKKRQHRTNFDYIEGTRCRAKTSLPPPYSDVGVSEEMRWWTVFLDAKV